MNVISGTVAPEGGDTGTRAPFQLTEPGRRDPDPSSWLRPLPPTLWRRLSDEDREAHERLAQGHAEAVARAAGLAAKVREVEAADERALRAALRDGKTPAKPKLPAAEQAAERAAHEAKVAAELVIENGGELVRKFSDAEMQEAIGDAQQTARDEVLEARSHGDAQRASLQRAGERGGEARWLAQLLERRRQFPWRTTSAPYSPRVAQAGQHAHEVRAYLDAEVGEQAHRDAPPPEHHAPAGAPPANTWTASGIDATR